MILKDLKPEKSHQFQSVAFFLACQSRLRTRITMTDGIEKEKGYERNAPLTARRELVSRSSSDCRSPLFRKGRITSTLYTSEGIAVSFENRRSRVLWIRLDAERRGPYS